MYLFVFQFRSELNAVHHKANKRNSSNKAYLKACKTSQHTCLNATEWFHCASITIMHVKQPGARWINPFWLLCLFDVCPYSSPAWLKNIWNHCVKVSSLCHLYLTLNFPWEQSLKKKSLCLQAPQSHHWPLCTELWESCSWKHFH